MIITIIIVMTIITIMMSVLHQPMSIDTFSY